MATHSTGATSTSTTWADTGLTATITPSAATSKILILSSQQFVHSREAASNNAGFRLLRGATFVFGDNAASGPLRWTGHFNSGSTVQNIRGNFTITYLDSPNTTSATTYKTQFAVENAANSATFVLNEASNTANIILLEIGA